MSLTMYSASVPVFVRMLNNLSTWIDKAEAHAQARRFDVNLFLASRLAPDMLPFTRQVQIACDGVKFAVARLAGIEAPKYDDSESSMAELRERIANTLAFVTSARPEQIEGSEGKQITVPRRNDPVVMTGEAYLSGFVLPNLYFHLTTVYALLRQGGVELGKMDFLGKL